MENKKGYETFYFSHPLTVIPYILPDLSLLRLLSPRNKDLDLLRYSILSVHLNILQLSLIHI